MSKRIRSINQVVKFIKDQDPDSRIGYTTIRNAIDRGEIRSFRSGNRYLIVLEDVYEYFTGTPLVEPSAKVQDSDSNE